MTLTLLHSKMFDVGDLPVGPTDFRQLCKTGVIKWPVKLNAGLRLFTFLRFSFKVQKHDFLRFLSRCSRFLERMITAYELNSALVCEFQCEQPRWNSRVEN